MLSFFRLRGYGQAYVALLVYSVSAPTDIVYRDFTRSILFGCIALKRFRSLCRTARGAHPSQTHPELVLDVAARFKCTSTTTGLGPPSDSVAQTYIRPGRPCSISQISQFSIFKDNTPQQNVGQSTLRFRQGAPPTISDAFSSVI